jgi:hypothetical protein
VEREIDTLSEGEAILSHEKFLSGGAARDIFMNELNGGFPWAILRTRSKIPMKGGTGHWSSTDHSLVLRGLQRQYLSLKTNLCRVYDEGSDVPKRAWLALRVDDALVAALRVRNIKPYHNMRQEAFMPLRDVKEMVRGTL